MLKKTAQAIQSEEMGFIKFGSRVDVFIPLHSEINVQMNQVVKGGISIIAKWNV